jgi:hypothetical protein
MLPSFMPALQAPGENIAKMMFHGLQKEAQEDDLSTRIFTSAHLCKHWEIDVAKMQKTFE